MSDWVSVDVPKDDVVYVFGYDMVDFYFEDYRSLQKLADAASWHLPMKVVYKSKKRLLQLLQIMDEEHAFGPEEIWSIIQVSRRKKILKFEHPTWAELNGKAKN